MSIQGSINSLFNQVLGLGIGKKLVKSIESLKDVKTEQDAAKFAEKTVPELREKDPHVQGALIREARRKMLESTPEGRKQLELQNNFNRQQANQMMAQKGIQQIQQRNDVKQRFEHAEQLSMFDTPKQTSLFDKKEGE